VRSKLEWLMLKKADANAVAPEVQEGLRSATGIAFGAAEVKRWSTGRKRGVVLRLLRGEPRRRRVPRSRRDYRRA
jgi:hypothetical protein